MNKLRIMFSLSVLLLAFVLIQSNAYASDFFAVEDIYPGLAGTGKTVIEGTRIDEFDIEVIDVIPEGGFDAGAMILLKVTGAAVDFSNGIAAGYSGSPIYFEGKLAGAISSAIPGTDTHICGATPIISMLKALDQGEERDYSENTVLPPAFTQFSTGPGGPVIPSDSDEENNETEAPSVIHTNDWDYAAKMNAVRTAPVAPVYAVPLKGRLLVGGVSARTFDMVEPILKGNSKLSGFTLAQGPSGAGPKGYGLLKEQGDINTLQPGDALAIAFVTGDFDLAGIGTLTYIDDQNRILAFGHGMFQDGIINMPFGKAYISYTYSDIMRGFKDGYMLNQVGTLTYDHAAAVGGIVGLQPDMIDVRINIKDIDLNQKKTYVYKIIRDEDLFETLLYMVTMMSYYQMLDRDGGGTIKITYRIESDELEETFERENYFYDNFNAASFVAAEALPTAAFILFNNYRDIRINTFSIDFEVTNNRINASVDKAEIIDPDAEEQQESEVEGNVEPETTEQAQNGSENIDTESEAANMQAEAEMAPDITAAEEEAPPPDLEVKEFMPGEIVNVKVTLQPYRGETIEQELMIRIPRDFPEGQTSLIVQGGGGLVSIYNEYGGKGTVLFPISAGPLPLGPEILKVDETLEKIKKGEKNNQLMVVIPRPPTPEEQQAESQGIPTDDLHPDEEKEIKVTIPMDYVIYDMYMLPINIVKTKSNGE
ncbi:hypothetical protein J7K50_09200 [bacterium]|nr:hypothetical protein [bacterium]